MYVSVRIDVGVRNDGADWLACRNNIANSATLVIQAEIYARPGFEQPALAFNALCKSCRLGAMLRVAQLG